MEKKNDRVVKKIELYIILTLLLAIAYSISFIFVKEQPNCNTPGMLTCIMLFNFVIIIVFYYKVLPFSKLIYNIIVIIYTVTALMLLFYPFIGFAINMGTTVVGMAGILPKYANRKK